MKNFIKISLIINSYSGYEFRVVRETKILDSVLPLAVTTNTGNGKQALAVEAQDLGNLATWSTTAFQMGFFTPELALRATSTASTEMRTQVMWRTIRLRAAWTNILKFKLNSLALA